MKGLEIGVTEQGVGVRYWFHYALRNVGLSFFIFSSIQLSRDSADVLLCTALLRRLIVIEGTKRRRCCKQFLWLASLDDPSFVEQDHTIIVAHGIQLVNGGDHRATLEFFAKDTLHEDVGIGVDLTRRFVEKKDAAWFDDCSGETNQLLLSNRYFILIEFGIKSTAGLIVFPYTNST